MSTLPRRAMGRLLRDLRGEITQLAASRVLEVSKQSVGRLEKGQPIKLSTADLNSLLTFYKADPEQRENVLALWVEVREAKAQKGTQRGWWKAYSNTYGQHFDHYLALEEAANRLSTFQLTLMPGLLQSPGYRRAVVRAAYPDVSLVDLERSVELMTRRQQRLSEDGDFRMDIVLSEMALRLPVGGPDVMTEQLDLLVKTGKLPNVSIRVVPASVVGYRGLMIGSFTLCEFPPLADFGGLIEPPVVYMESHEGALFLDDETSVSRYRGVILEIQRVALPVQRSRELILDAVENLR